MTMYEIYRYVFIGGLVLSIVMLIATILIFFLLNINKAIGDVTGSNKRKGVQNIHQKSKASEAEAKKKQQKKYDPEKQTPSARLASESVETSKISPQDRYDTLEGETTDLEATALDTTVLNTSETTTPNEPAATADTTVLKNTSETTVLNNASETTVLSANETTVLDTGNTTVISNDAQAETTVLGENVTAPGEIAPGFAIELDITYVHSAEVIR